MAESKPATASHQTRNEPAPAAPPPGSPHPRSLHSSSPPPEPPLGPRSPESDTARIAVSAAGGNGAVADGDGAAEGSAAGVGDREALAELWGAIQAALARRVQREQFETWFRRANLVAVGGETVDVAVQNGFVRDWLLNYYGDVLESAVSAVLGVRRRVAVTVDPELTVPPRSLAAVASDSAALDGKAVEAALPCTIGCGSGGSGGTGPGGSALAVSGAPDARPHRRPAMFEEEASTAPTAQHRGSPFDPSPRAERPSSDAPRPGSPPRASTANGASCSGGPGSGLGDSGLGGHPGLHQGAKLLWNSDIVLNPKYTFENFVVGPCNRFGHAAAMGAGEAPGKSYNPFFLHGRVGVGKTHLLQAVCFTILDRWERARILYLSCETFVNHFISALENGDLTEFRNKYRNVDVLVVDDIHLLANKERTQEEFFHTFNTLYNAGKQIVLSSDSPPKDIPTLQERLVSRFKWGMVTEIEPPCYETRMAIVKRKSRDRGQEVPDEVAQLIAEHVDQNVRELEGAVTRLLGFSSLTNQEITVELAREALGDLLHVRTGAPSMEDILTVVTEHFGVKLSELQSKKRTKSIAYPRQVAMFLARKITRHSLEEIGGFFGGRDHSTVLYAVDRIASRIASDEDCRKQMDTLLTRLGRAG